MLASYALVATGAFTAKCSSCLGGAAVASLILHGVDTPWQTLSLDVDYRRLLARCRWSCRRGQPLPAGGERHATKRADLRGIALAGICS